ncbi:MAG: hypothetical protein KTV16_11660, partial [Acidimicrobiia bacterium]|nr:hypothetical protein [Acidimicrobiia bacterium]
MSLSQGVLGPSRVSVAENDFGRVATYSVLGSADPGALEWSLAGSDAAHFTIDEPAGALRLRVEPAAPQVWPAATDFEVPRDKDGDNVYEVTVIASISDGTTARRAVEVTVTDVDEVGEVSLSTARPRVGQPLTATLNDPETGSVDSALSDPDTGAVDSALSDPDTGAVEWVWERSAGRNNWVTIEGATGAVYVPRAADAGEHLRVTA